MRLSHQTDCPVPARNVEHAEADELNCGLGEISPRGRHQEIVDAEAYEARHDKKEEQVEYPGFQQFRHAVIIPAADTAQTHSRPDRGTAPLFLARPRRPAARSRRGLRGSLRS